jgi:3-deoxy-7-phosphoheptulonate synthase
MIVVMKAGATNDEIDAVVERVEELGYRAHLIRGVERTVVGCVGDERQDKSIIAETLPSLPGVANVMPILDPYKLASRQFKQETSVIRITDEVAIGGKKLVVMAGPCSVEGEEQLFEVAQAVKEAGGTILRGGAFKPRTSPYSFQGLEEEGLKLLARARDLTGLPIVTEVMDAHDVDIVSKYTDILQVGARNVQNFSLLKRVGKAKRPVLLKRGLSTTIKEWLQSAEYILSEGNPDVILCERGIRTFETTTRNTLDLNCVPVLKEKTHLPVIVDPSHATGVWRYVIPMAYAGVACGADGIMVEVHPKPDKAWSDGAQSLKPKRFTQLMVGLKPFAEAAGRTV